MKENVIRFQHIYLEAPKQNLEEIIRHQAGPAEVSRVQNTAALHIVQAVKAAESDPSSPQELPNSAVLPTAPKGF